MEMRLISLAKAKIYRIGRVEMVDDEGNVEELKTVSIVLDTIDGVELLGEVDIGDKC
jgi:hypothetical protein